jgi:hypothetical protein
LRGLPNSRKRGFPVALDICCRFRQSPGYGHRRGDRRGPPLNRSWKTRKEVNLMAHLSTLLRSSDVQCLPERLSPPRTVSGLRAARMAFSARSRRIATAIAGATMPGGGEAPARHLAVPSQSVASGFPRGHGRRLRARVRGAAAWPGGRGSIATHGRSFSGAPDRRSGSGPRGRWTGSGSRHARWLRQHDPHATSRWRTSARAAAMFRTRPPGSATRSRGPKGPSAGCAGSPTAAPPSDLDLEVRGRRR